MQLFLQGCLYTTNSANCTCAVQVMPSEFTIASSCSQRQLAGSHHLSESKTTPHLAEVLCRTILCTDSPSIRILHQLQVGHIYVCSLPHPISFVFYTTHTHPSLLTTVTSSGGLQQGRSQVSKACCLGGKTLGEIPCGSNPHNRLAGRDKRPSPESEGFTPIPPGVFVRFPPNLRQNRFNITYDTHACVGIAMGLH